VRTVDCCPVTPNPWGAMPDPVRRVLQIFLALAAQLACAAGTGWSSLQVGQQAVAEAAAASGHAREAYFPGPGDDWERRRPVEVGMDSAAVTAAVDFAIANESPFGHDLRAYLKGRLLTTGPYGEIVGPMKDRGDPNGLILRGGYIVAEWGDTDRVDMTFSITKSYLSTTGGLAWDARLIRDLEDPVSDYLRRGEGRELFASAHNASITWQHLFTQTSEWEGTLWEKPDAADRRRGPDRELEEPGSFWEYNDVRVNLAAYALLRVHGRGLPEVLRDRVMDPIGASDSWAWHGYRTSWVSVGGRRVQSVSGGGHWGGGMWINSRDQARFGYLFLRRGRWDEEQILSEEWVRLATRPSEVEPTYGYMWWLNADHLMWEDLPDTSFAALGAGTNAIWIDPEDDLVVVVRWIDRARLGDFLTLVKAAVEKPVGPATREER
jgi:CubicO group peptidase (beta-lactamase class C family)